MCPSNSETILHRIIRGFKYFLFGDKSTKKRAIKKRGTDKKPKAFRKRSFNAKVQAGTKTRSHSAHSGSRKRNQPAIKKSCFKSNVQSIKTRGNSVPVKRKLIGRVTHYFSKIKVAVIKLDNPIKLGDKIFVENKVGSFSQAVDSMQVESVDVRSAAKGKLVGMRVMKEAKIGAIVYKI